MKAMSMLEEFTTWDDEKVIVLNDVKLNLKLDISGSSKAYLEPPAFMS